MKKILLIGNGAREHAIAKQIKASRQANGLFIFAASQNPGIKALATDYQVGDISNNSEIVDYALDNKITLAVIGPEAPLAQGIVDDLEVAGIASFGPTKKQADLEVSKAFTRDLLTEYQIPACPLYQVFATKEGLADFIMAMETDFVIKPDGLTGGKGVMVQGDHFNTKEQGIKLAEEIISAGGKLVIEEKLIGQEFSLISICDGDNLFHFPAVQDHKRAFVGDQGPNTGGMGTYSDQDFSLPFLHNNDIVEAQKINEATTKALKNKFGCGYKGVLYGGFIALKTGVKLIEYNARFGDPEAMNLLVILKNDFVDICEAVISGTLDKIIPEFEPVATVCKYVVPDGYPNNPVKDVKIDISLVDTNKVDIFYAAVDEQKNGLYLTGSRAIALVGRHQDLYEAEKIVEQEIQKIKGPIFHREDIGTRELIEKRVEMMKSIRSNN